MESLRVVAIGDPHIKENYLVVAREFVQHAINQISEIKPDIIVVLGDLLDTHNVVRTQSHKLAIYFLKELGKIAPVYFILGNHDMMDASQFLTDNHIFTPLQGVESLTNIYVCDQPLWLSIKGYYFVFCPFVPPGRFEEALNLLVKQGKHWCMADCIFAHQEFRGAKMGAKISEEGDEWSKDYPLVISGHIHDAQSLNANLHYTGSAIQHSFSETGKKGLWLITFERDQETCVSWSFQVLENRIRTKKTVTLSVQDAINFVVPDDSEWRVKVVDDQEKIEAFNKTTKNGLIEKGIKVIVLPKKIEARAKSKGTFWDNLYYFIKDSPNAKKFVSKYE